MPEPLAARLGRGAPRVREPTRRAPKRRARRKAPARGVVGEPPSRGRDPGEIGDAENKTDKTDESTLRKIDPVPAAVARARGVRNDPRRQGGAVTHRAPGARGAGCGGGD